jgi:hypothetical protein
VKASSVQVFHIRLFCESRDEYSASRLRGPGFLRLSFDSKELDDDSFYFYKTFNYPDLYQNSAAVASFVSVQVREVRDCEICCGTIVYRHPCHVRLTIRSLRPVLSAING